MRKLILITILAILLTPKAALAGDGVTVIFKSGQIVKIDDGYRQISETLKKNDGKDSSLVELNIGSGNFILNLREVLVVCRDSCSNLKIMHQLDPERGRGGMENGH